MVIHPHLSDGRGYVFELPCGTCIGCRLRRAQGWALRLGHEAKAHAEASFVTLTYDDAHLPPSASLHYPDFQRFLKRLRKRTKVRFFCVGEYGAESWRPHYHAILFGFAFRGDRKECGKSLFCSALADRCWSDPVSGEPMGLVRIGDVSPASIAYVAGYVVEKHDPRTLAGRSRPFARMSLRPAIGRNFLDRFSGDFRHDYATYDGRKIPLPRYYRDLLNAVEPMIHEDHAYARFLRQSGLPASERSPERRAVQEEVAQAKVRHFSSRSL